MGTVVREAIGLPVFDPEGSSIILDKKYFTLSLEQLFTEAGVEAISWRVESGLDYEIVGDEELYSPRLIGLHKDAVKHWRDEHPGKKYPPAFRIKVTLELEECSEQETEEFWANRYKGDS